ncbi:MAG: DUF4091 domain-containing protein [Victivallales bacterium]|nr:DUF4091 domain-containing protein [Victivallales bacterium]
MKLRLLALPLLVLALHVQAAGWAPEKALCAFRDKADLARWRLRRSTPVSTFELGKDSSGKPAASLLYPAYTGKGEKWPAIVLAGARVPVTDWRNYRYFRVFLTSPLGGKLPLAVYLKNHKGTIGKSALTLPAGETSGWITVDLDAVLPERQKIGEVHFYMSLPAMDCPFTLRDITLVGEDGEEVAARVLAKVAERMGKLTAMGEPAVGALVQGKALWAELNARLAELRAKPGDTTGQPMLAAANKARAWLASPEQKALLAKAPYLTVAARVAAEASFGYGIASSATKVLWQDVPFAGEYFGRAEIALAGDEEESIQIAAIALRDVKGLRAELIWETPACPLTTEVGWMGHVKTGKTPHVVDYQGWWPDPILTFLEQVDVPAERTEALWITVRAPRGVAAGEYKGTVALTCDDGTSYNVPLIVRVHPFDLPVKRHLPLALSWGEMTRTAYGLPADKSKAYVEAVAQGIPLAEIADPEVRRLVGIRNRTAEFLLRKRAEPDMIYRSSPPNLDEVERWIKLGMTRFNVLHLSADKARNRGILEKIMPEIKRRGLMEYAYVYGFDEVRPKVFPKVKDVFGDVKKRWPELQIMTTAYDHSFGLDTGLKDVVDIWVPLTPRYMANLEKAAQARAEGMQIWWYTCVGPRHPYANWFIEYPAIEARLLMGEQAFFAGTEGYLYYQLSRWVHRQYDDPITKPIVKGPLTDWDPRSFNDNNGDGSVFCAGPDGPLSTIRLENIRDGLEDYEYLWMLRRALALVETGKAARPAETWAAATKQALRPPQKIADFMTKYSRDPKVLLDRRDRVARLLAAWMKANGLRSPPEE